MSVNAINETRLLSPGQTAALLEWVGDHAPDGRTLRAFLASIAWAALRPREAVALRVRDVILPEQGLGTLLIAARPQGQGHGGKTGTVLGDGRTARTMPAPSQLVEVLREEISRRDLGPDDLMFAGPKGEALSAWGYRQVWKQAREAVLQPHEVDSPFGRHVSDLRDACVARWLARPVTAGVIVTVAQYLGVSASWLAQRYLHRVQVPDEITSGLIEAALALPGLSTAEPGAPRRR